MASKIYEVLERVLSVGQLGDVASDHRAEIEGFRGWNHVAISFIAKQAARALVYVYEDNGKESQNFRKSMRMAHGLNWRKAVVREHQGQIAPQEHPLVKLSHRPNPYQSGGSFRWEQIQQLRIHGTSLVFNRPNTFAVGSPLRRTVERYVIPLALVTPIRPGRYRNMPSGGILISPNTWNQLLTLTDGDDHLQNGLNQFVNIPLPAEMLSITRYPHPYLRGDGCSPTWAAADWIDAGANIDDTRRKFFKDGPMGKVLLTADIDDPKKVKELERRLSEAVGDDGPRVVVVGNSAAMATKNSADEMGFVESHDQMRDGVLAAHHLSKAAVGMQDGMTYGSLAASVMAATALTVQPDMDLIADQETIDLSKEYGGTVCVEYEVPAVNDPEMEENRLAADSQRGVITVGEYRQKRGEKPFGTPYDDYIMTSSGNVDPKTLLSGDVKLEAPSDAPRIESDAGISPDLFGDFAAKSEGMVPVEKSLRSVGRSILIDDTMMEGLDPGFVSALTDSGIDVISMGDAEEEDEEPLAVWTWEQGADARMLVKTLPEDAADAVIQRFPQAGDEPEKEHRYGCVYLPLPEDSAKRMREFGCCLPDDQIGPGGREDEPHVTALYGLIGADEGALVAELSRMTAPAVLLRPLMTFSGGDDGVPLVAEVQSDDMRRMNESLRSKFAHVLKYPDYKPHVTVAYLNEETSDPGRHPLEGRSVFLPRAIVSLPGRDKIVVPLRRPYVEEDRPG